VCVCVCACVWERERGRESVCVIPTPPQKKKSMPHKTHWLELRHFVVPYSTQNSVRYPCLPLLSVPGPADDSTIDGLCMCCITHTWDMTHPHVWHDTSHGSTIDGLCMCCVTHIWDMTHPHVWHDTLHDSSSHGLRMRCVPYIYVCIYIYVRHDSFMCVVWLVHMCGMTPHTIPQSMACVCAVSLIRGTWLIHMCDMTPHTIPQSMACVCVLGVSLICVIQPVPEIVIRIQIEILIDHHRSLSKTPIWKKNPNFDHSGFRFEFWWPFRVSFSETGCMTRRVMSRSYDPSDGASLICICVAAYRSVYVLCVSLLCVTWLVRMTPQTVCRSYVYVCACKTRPYDPSDDGIVQMTRQTLCHSCVTCHTCRTCTCVTWLVYVCDVTRWHVWRGPLYDSAIDGLCRCRSCSVSGEWCV